jgi:transposase
MAVELLPDDLWKEVEPLIPPRPPHPKGGRPPADDRLCLRGLIFIDRSGISYGLLPAEVFGVSGVTCWRRLRDWTASGVWPQLHRKLLDHLGRLGHVDPSRVVVDSQSVRAVFGGRTPDRTR